MGHVLRITLCFLGCWLFVYRAAEAGARNENHPYTVLTAQDIVQIKDAVVRQEPRHVFNAYKSAEGYALATQEHSPSSEPGGAWYDAYYVGLDDSEKMTAFAIVYVVTDDSVWATRAKSFVLNFVDNWSIGSGLRELSYQINTMYAYDLTAHSGVYSASEKERIWTWIYNFANAGGCGQTPNWEQNGSWTGCGRQGLAALMVGDATLMAQARKGFQDRVGLTDWDPNNIGAAPDFTIRNCDGLAYHEQSVVGLWVPALTAYNLGESGWYDYKDGMLSLENTLDWFHSGVTSCDSSGCGRSWPQCDYWVPIYYGNLGTGRCEDNTDSQNTGAYADNLTEAECSDKRYVYEIGYRLYGKQSYLDTLQDTSDGKIERGQLFHYHVGYWLPALLNSGEPTAPPADTTPPAAPVNVWID